MSHTHVHVKTALIVATRCVDSDAKGQISSKRDLRLTRNSDLAGIQERQIVRRPR